MCSARGAPGVTTTALLIAAHLDAVLVEADLAGGVVAIRYGLGREPGLVTLAAANPRDTDGWRDHAQDAGGVTVLVGPDVAPAAESLWRTAGDRLVRAIDRGEGWAVVDAGRVWTRPRPLETADVVLLVARPNAESLVAVTHALPTLTVAGWCQVGVVLVGDGPYRAGDLGDRLGAPILAHLPEDSATADHLRNGGSTPRALARSRLSRSVAGLAELIGERHLAAPEPVAAP